MVGSNQLQVIQFLNGMPHHEATEIQLRALLYGKNWKKVITSMLGNNSLDYNSTTGMYVLVDAPAISADHVVPAVPTVPEVTPGGDVLRYLTAHTALTLDSRSGLVDLTASNAAIINSYIPQGIQGLAKKYLPNAHMLYTSLAGGNPSAFNFRNYNNVKAVVSQIDKDNGTLDNKNHQGSAIEAFTQFIVDPINDFERRLDGSTPVIKQLVDDLLSYYLGMSNAYRAKSLASKVCKYFHEYRFNHDKFFINDSVVRKMLPYYCDKYGIEHPTKKDIDRLSYSALFDLLDSVYSHCSGAISKSDFDHILWYCYRK